MRIGIDFGGTKTEVIALHGRNGRELYRQRIPTKKGNYDDTIKSFIDLVLSAEEATGQAGRWALVFQGH